MGILSRFGDIVQANVNAVLDKMEDPSKMIDQYLRELNENLAEVKKETAGVMAEETRTRPAPALSSCCFFAKKTFASPSLPASSACLARSSYRAASA